MQYHKTEAKLKYPRPKRIAMLGETGMGECLQDLCVSYKCLCFRRKEFVD